MGRPKAIIKKETLSVKIPVELKNWLTDHCDMTGNNLSDIIISLLEYYRGMK